MLSFYFSALFLANLGFYFIPGALSVEEQCQWIRESMASFPQPPNRTNHNALYGPIENLFAAAKENKVLVEVEQLPGDRVPEIDLVHNIKSAPRWKFFDKTDKSCTGDGGKSALASVLLRKLRWSTLGLQFDWSKVLFASFSPLYCCRLTCIISTVSLNLISVCANDVPKVKCLATGSEFAGIYL